MHFSSSLIRLLLALLTLLVFGSCGGGVNYFLANLGTKRRQQWRGRARRDEDDRIERYTNARLDSLLPAIGHRKFAKRRAKAERQLRQHPD